MAIAYPIIVVLIVDKVRFIEYFRAPLESFKSLGEQFSMLGVADIVILSFGFFGSILAGVIIRLLRIKGYQMF